MVVQQGVSPPERATKPEVLVTMALEPAAQPTSQPFVRHEVWLSTRHCFGEVLSLNPGKVRTSGGGWITTLASGQEVTQGLVTHFTPEPDILLGG